jgi:hypothetical protein
VTTSTASVDAGAVAAPAGAAEDRQRRLALAVARLRRRTAGFPPDRWLPVAGAVLVPLGISCIALGWYGAAHTTRLYQQVPYVLSGGVAGLAFVFAGGFAYFAAWMTRQVHETRAQADRLAALLEAGQEQSARMADALDRMETRLEDGRR